MAETQAASSPAEAVDPFEGEQVSLHEFSKYRETGELPARFKPAEAAESAPADAPEETAETEETPEAESDAEEAQEPPQKAVSPAEKRIKQLLAEKKELQRRLEAAAKPTQTDSSSRPAPPPPPQTFDEWIDRFDVDRWEEEYASSHPQASFGKMQLERDIYIDKVRDHFRGIEQRAQAEKQALDSKVAEARERYENFDEITDNFLSQVIDQRGVPQIPLPVLAIVNDSEYLADLLYTIGEDEGELAKFVAMAKANPNKAIRYVTRVESLIAEELAKPRDAEGKFTEKAPEPKKTAAPKPPSPVNGGTSRAFDVNDESLSTEEWMRKRNHQLGVA